MIPILICPQCHGFSITLEVIVACDHDKKHSTKIVM